MRAQDLLTKLEPMLDMTGAIALLQRVVGCESVTGNEAGVAGVLAGELQALGAEGVALQAEVAARYENPVEHADSKDKKQWA